MEIERNVLRQCEAELVLCLASKIYSGTTGEWNDDWVKAGRLAARLWRHFSHLLSQLSKLLCFPLPLNFFSSFSLSLHLPSLILSAVEEVQFSEHG
jgi:hypothetical protein